jgi:hypothetical protein
MHVPANFPHVFVRVSKYWLRSSSCISLRGLSYKSSIVFLLTKLINTCRFKQASLYVAFTFFVSTTTSFHFVSKNVLETELGEALNDKEIYLKSTAGRN